MASPDGIKYLEKGGVDEIRRIFRDLDSLNQVGYPVGTRMKRDSGTDKSHDKRIRRGAVRLTLQKRIDDLEARNNALIKSLHNMEESLREFTDLLDLASVGLLLLDRDGLIKNANSTAAKLLDVWKSWPVAKPLVLFVAGESREVFYLHLWSVRNTATKQDCVVKLKRKDGSLFDARLESIASEADKRIIFTTITDISDQKKAEDALLGAYEELRAHASGGARRETPLKLFMMK